MNKVWPGIVIIIVAIVCVVVFAPERETNSEIDSLVKGHDIRTTTPYYATGWDVPDDAIIVPDPGEVEYVEYDSGLNWDTDSSFTFGSAGAVMTIAPDGTFTYMGEEVKGAPAIYEKFVEFLGGACSDCPEPDPEELIGSANVCMYNGSYWVPILSNGEVTYQKFLDFMSEKYYGDTQL